MLGGHDPLKERHYIMYVFSGGGYGGSADGGGLTNGCSTIGSPCGVPRPSLAFMSRGTAPRNGVTAAGGD